MIFTNHLVVTFSDDNFLEVSITSGPSYKTSKYSGFIPIDFEKISIAFTSNNMHQIGSLEITQKWPNKKVSYLDFENCWKISKSLKLNRLVFNASYSDMASCLKCINCNIHLENELIAILNVSRQHDEII